MSKESASVDKKEMFDFLVAECMKQHNMDKSTAEKYVLDNINTDTLEKLAFQTNTMILMARDNPSIVDGMMEKLKDL